MNISYFLEKKKKNYDHAINVSKFKNKKRDNHVVKISLYIYKYVRNICMFV